MPNPMDILSEVNEISIILQPRGCSLPPLNFQNMYLKCSNRRKCYFDASVVYLSQVFDVFASNAVYLVINELLDK